MVKKFVFGRLIDKENICNLKLEQQKILHNITNNNNIIIYGPRNYGKTSLIKNIIIPEFKKQNRNAFVFFIDTFNATDNEALNYRFKAALENSMKQLPIKKWTDDLKQFFGALRPSVSLDPNSGSTSISFDSLDYKNHRTIDDVMEILTKLSKTKKVLLIFDEFQDTAGLKSALGIIRSKLQSINASTIIMGSKQHLLAEIFTSPREPFYQWGISIDFKPIGYDKYTNYLNERFALKNLKIEKESSNYLQNLMHRVPESINILANEILEQNSKKSILNEEIVNALLSLTDNRRSEYENLLRVLNFNDQVVITSIAKEGGIEKYNATEYLSKLRMNNKTVANIYKRLLDEGHIEIFKNKYRVNDPLLETYLKIFR